MKIGSMKEADIRPTELFQRYLELSAQDSRAYFCSEREGLPCPACGADRIEPVFEKNGFGYVVCQNCGTLYQSPRPSQREFFRFYQESPSSQYWSKTFFPAVAETRRVQLFRPKAQEIARLCQADGFKPQVFADIGAGYGLLLEESRAIFPAARLIAVEPNPDLAAHCRAKDLEVLECFAEEAAALWDQVDLATSFEVIEHVHDPLEFLVSLHKLLRPQGRLLITGPTVDGFDIQVLWENSKSVFPPHHLNLISVQGFDHLLSRAGFSQGRIFTPGKLDVDIVLNAISENQTLLEGQRFLRTLLRRREDTKSAFQNFLREHQLSSHCWVWAVKASTATDMKENEL